MGYQNSKELIAQMVFMWCLLLLVVVNQLFFSTVVPTGVKMRNILINC